MQQLITTDRKPPRRRPARGTRPFQYDRHGDPVLDDLDDDCGATALPTDDPMFSRLLAESPRTFR